MFWCIRALLKLQNFHGSTSRSTVFVNVSSLCLTVHEKDQHIKMLSSRRVQGLMTIQIHHQYHYGPCVRLRPILPCRAAHFVPSSTLRARHLPAAAGSPRELWAGTRGHRATSSGRGRDPWTQSRRQRTGVGAKITTHPSKQHCLARTKQSCVHVCGGQEAISQISYPRGNSRKNSGF